MSTLKTSRRDFLKVTSLTGGGLVLGFSWFGSDAAPVIVNSDAVANLNFNSYLSIATDGTITILSPNPELGQNVMTSFPMIVAEELDADWSKVKVLQAPFFDKPSMVVTFADLIAETGNVQDLTGLPSI